MGMAPENSRPTALTEALCSHVHQLRAGFPLGAEPDAPRSLSSAQSSEARLPPGVAAPPPRPCVRPGPFSPRLRLRRRKGRGTGRAAPGGRRSARPRGGGGSGSDVQVTASPPGAWRPRPATPLCCFTARTGERGSARRRPARAAAASPRESPASPPGPPRLGTPRGPGAAGAWGPGGPRLPASTLGTYCRLRRRPGARGRSCSVPLDLEEREGAQPAGVGRERGEPGLAPAASPVASGLRGREAF